MYKKTNRTVEYRREYKKLYSRKRYARVEGHFFGDRLCERCGASYSPTRRSQRFCGIKCSTEARRKYLDIPSCLYDASRKLDKIIGYVRVYCPMHPEANSRGYVYEHRLIAEKMICRRLSKSEVVHHKNGKRWDNREINLEVMNKKDHDKLYGQREEDMDI